MAGAAALHILGIIDAGNRRCLRAHLRTRSQAFLAQFDIGHRDAYSYSSLL